MVYLNYAALGPIRPEAEQEVQKTMEEFRGLLYSKAGIQWYLEKVEACRQKVARLFPLQNPSSIAFVPNASTANFLVLSFQKWEKGDIVLTTTHENPSVLRELHALARYGVDIQILKPDSPSGLVATVETAVSKGRVKGIVLSHVSHVDGRILPIGEVGWLAHQKNILFLVDGAQAVGQIPVDLSQLHFDVYFFPGHKWCFGPLGTGALLMDNHFLELNPTFGEECLKKGTFPATRFEIGTHNIGLIAGLATACEIKAQEGLRGEELEPLRRKIEAWAANRVDIQGMGWKGPHAPGMFTIGGLTPEKHSGLIHYLETQWNIIGKQFIDYPESTTPALRLSWASPSDQEPIQFALEKIAEYLDQTKSRTPPESFG